MGVEIHGNADIRVAEDLLQRFGLHARFDSARGKGVAEGVGAEALDPGVPADAVDIASDAARAEQPAARRAKDRQLLIVADRLPEMQPVLFLLRICYTD